MRCSKRSAGHSLFELMIASALVGICLLGVLALVSAGTRYLLVTNAKTDLQRDALIVMRQLAQEFSETNDGSFRVGYTPAGNIPPGQVCESCFAGHAPTDSGPPWTPFPAGNSTHSGVIFASPRSPISGDVVYDAAGRMFWPKYVCYYRRIENNVPCIAREVVHIPDPTAFPPAAPSLATFLAAPNPYKIVARNVTLFHCVKAASSLGLHLRMDLASGYGKRYGFEVRSQVFTRN